MLENRAGSTSRHRSNRRQASWRVEDCCAEPARRRLLLAVPLLGLLRCADSFAAVVGVNPAARSLSVDRLVEVAAPERDRWAAYLGRSAAQMAADKAALASERASLAAPFAAPAESGDGIRTMPLGMPAAWYASAEARLIVDNILGFQTPAGGWGKNQPRNRAPRAKGQAFVAASRSSPELGNRRHDTRWSHVGTIDNGATVSEIRFLAKAGAELPDAEPLRRSVLRGLDYLLAAQFPNGGWPQVWPLQGGYHDAMTLNDDAMLRVVELMGDAARGEAEWRFLPDRLRARAADAERLAVAVLLQAQIEIDGRKTLWAQQHDALTLQPTPARNYEPAALASAESARVLLYLMSLPGRSDAIDAAVEPAIATLRKLAIADSVWRKPADGDGFRLLPQPGAPPLWARYHDVATLQPIFADRDRRIVDDVDEISAERRNGYAWFGRWPAKALHAFEAWRTHSDRLPR